MSGTSRTPRDDAGGKGLAGSSAASAMRSLGTRARAGHGRDAGADATKVSAASAAPGSTSARRRLDLRPLSAILVKTEPFRSLAAKLGAPDAPLPRDGRHASVSAIPHGAKTYLASALAEGPGDERICWIARDAEIGDRVADELRAWLGDPDSVVVLEPRTALAFERSELVRDETAARVAALAAWRYGRARVLVASVQALLQPTLRPDEIPERPLTLRPGGRVRQEELLRELLGLGYEPVVEVAGRGEMARRGGIVDVFPSGAELPVRIELFGDEIESLRAFDPADQRSLRPVDSVSLLPATELLAPPAKASIRRLATALGTLPERLAADLERFEPAAPVLHHPVGHPPATGAGSKKEAADASRALDVGDAAEVWAALVCGATPLDHVDPDSLLILDEPAELRGAAESLWDQATERRGELVAAGELPQGWPSAYLEAPEWDSRLGGARTLSLSWEPDEDAPATDDGESGGLHLAASGGFEWREPGSAPVQAGRLAPAIERWRSENRRVVIASDQAARVAEILTEAGTPVGIADRLTEPPPLGAITLLGRSLNAGFIGGPDGIALVTDRELFGSVRVRRPKALRRVVPRDLIERLAPGDLVVHVDHGIARYRGMVRRGAPGDERDYLDLAFAGTDGIFVPVEQIGRLSRYGGGESPTLSKLGGGEWQRTKARVRKAVTDLAAELLELYAARASQEGIAFPPDTPWQQEMEAAFPYEETPDQLRAILDAKADMEAGRPMDRLVVGDVGYGKTEVAVRAAFKALQGERQVAVLVPTTVLAAQHYQTFSNRLAAFPVKVRMLSRFVPPAEQEKTIQGLADGSVDIVVGTHRILSKDVTFRDLGLVVVDEEHRFGVAAKERLKQLRREIDVLTLSATPIPRTLNLALSGVRDLSVIETPPEDRLPIQTRVAEASTGLVRDAILRELDRGGQVFFVHNRVETIEAQAEQLRELVSNAKVIVGHGQMAEGMLEKVMLKFSRGEADILLCTTIIESGIDIPNANTIIIDRADTLGLAQLYQLRGRVGRSSRRAYAYLLYRRKGKLSEDARRRLQAIFNASELGAGFQIALADLEIRGAGNILGAEQSGHMAAVGFDLYSQMLAEAVEERKASYEGRAPKIERPGATIDLPVDAHMPDTYIPDEAQKLELYRRLAKVRAPGELAAFRQELADRFGPPPDPVLRLIEVAELRIAAEAAGIASIGREEGSLVVRFGTLSRAAAMRALAPFGREVTYGSNQARIRLPRDPLRSWSVAQSAVARIASAVEGSPGSAPA